MEDYIARVRENVAGQGIVTEIRIEIAAYPNGEGDGSRSSSNGGAGSSNITLEVTHEEQLDDAFPPPPSNEMLDALSKQFEDQTKIGSHVKRPSSPPPPLPRKPSSPSSASATTSEGTFFAQPYNHANRANGVKPVFMSGPKPYGSTSSSLDSSRNASPSPTSEDHSAANYPPPPALSRPSKYTGNSLPVPGQYRQQQPQRKGPGLVAPPVPSKSWRQHHSGSSPASPTSSSSGSSTTLQDTPRVVVGACMDCDGELRQGDVAVQADRAGPNKMWHPQCFKCHTCQVRDSERLNTRGQRSHCHCS